MDSQQANELRERRASKTDNQIFNRAFVSRAGLGGNCWDNPNNATFCVERKIKLITFYLLLKFVLVSNNSSRASFELCGKFIRVGIKTVEALFKALLLSVCGRLIRKFSFWFQSDRLDCCRTETKSVNTERRKYFSDLCSFQVDPIGSYLSAICKQVAGEQKASVNSFFYSVWFEIYFFSLFSYWQVQYSFPLNLPCLVFCCAQQSAQPFNFFYSFDKIF